MAIRDWLAQCQIRIKNKFDDQKWGMESDLVIEFSLWIWSLDPCVHVGHIFMWYDSVEFVSLRCGQYIEPAWLYLGCCNGYITNTDYKLLSNFCQAASECKCVQLSVFLLLCFLLFWFVCNWSAIYIYTTLQMLAAWGGAEHLYCIERSTTEVFLWLPRVEKCSTLGKMLHFLSQTLFYPAVQLQRKRGGTNTTRTE